MVDSSPLWTPDLEQIAHTRIDGFRRYVNAQLALDLIDVRELQQWSINHPGDFWGAVWDYFEVVGDRGETTFIPAEFPQAIFFPEARMNLAENILRKIPSRDDADGPFVISTGEAGDGVHVTAVRDREDVAGRVAAMAAVLRERGVRSGDRIVLVLPVGLVALEVTLAALAIGAVVASASPEFGVSAIVDRFDQLDPVLLVGTTSYQWNGSRYSREGNLVDLVKALPSIRSVLIAPGADDPTTPIDPDIVDVARIAALIASGGHRSVRVDDYETARASHAGAEEHYERFSFDHPAYVLFSSGTTGKPKCLVHRSGGALLKHLVEAGLHSDTRPGDRLLFYTTTGWMLWNWILSVPATGATLVMHDGAPHYPSPDVLFDIASLCSLTHLGMGARLLDTMRTSHCTLTQGRDLTALRMVLVTGSPLTAVTGRWLADQLGPTVQPNPISGGTDLIGMFVGGDPTQPVWPGELPWAGLGMDVDVFDEDGHPIVDDTPGELICRTTFPTVPLKIWGDETGERLHETYFARFPGVWTHGDLTSKTAQGGFVIHGRSDATLNVAGVRIGTGEIYSAMETLPEIIDSLAFAQQWDNDTRMVLLVVLAADACLDDELISRIKATLRTQCSPRHVPNVIVEVEQLPRTLTGKLAEVAVAQIVNGRPVRNRDALANPEALDAISTLMFHRFRD
jgi:acetoacetyl-CoA synthetase